MWNVETTDRFDEWFFEQTTALKEDVLAAMHILSEFGPQLGRPFVDTVKASAFGNMKELRIQMIALADVEYHRHLANKEAIWQR